MSNVINIETVRQQAAAQAATTKRNPTANLPVKLNRERIRHMILHGESARSISHNLGIPIGSVRLVLRGWIMIGDRFRSSMTQRYPMGAKDTLAEIEGVVWGRLEREITAPGYGRKEAA